MKVIDVLNTLPLNGETYLNIDHGHYFIYDPSIGGKCKDEIYEAGYLNLEVNELANSKYSYEVEKNEKKYWIDVPCLYIGVDHSKIDIVSNLISLAATDEDTKKDLIDKIHRSDTNIKDLISYLVSKIPDFYKNKEEKDDIK